MDEVCKYIKSVCDITTLDEDYLDDHPYIEFDYSEDIDWKTEDFINYICEKLKFHLGADVSSITSSIEDERVSVMFAYKGFSGVVWETYNSRNYHYWVVNI
jgi:hypothetical protein